MIKYRIYRYPEGISLNGKEFILDENDDVKLFKSERAALNFLNDNNEGEKINDADEYFETYGIGIEENISENGYVEGVE